MIENASCERVGACRDPNDELFVLGRCSNGTRMATPLDCEPEEPWVILPTNETGCGDNQIRRPDPTLRAVRNQISA